MVTLICQYANGIFEPLDLTFSNGSKMMYEKDFEAMVAKAPEYWADKVRREIITVLRPGQATPTREATIRIQRVDTPAPPSTVVAMPASEEGSSASVVLSESKGGIPVVSPVAVGESLDGVDNSTVVEEDLTKAPPVPGKIDTGKVTRAQASVKDT
jgi:hypothetical protein